MNQIIEWIIDQIIHSQQFNCIQNWHLLSLIPSRTAFLFIVVFLLLIPQNGGNLQFWLLCKISLFYDPLSQSLKNFIYITALLGACFHKSNFIFLSQCLAMLHCDLSISIQIRFCADQDHVGVRISNISDLIDPADHMSKTDNIGDGVYQYDAIGSLVERFGNVAKSLLACSVPNVQRHLTIPNHDPFNLEVHPNSAEVFTLEGVLTVPHEKTRLANTTVTHHKIFQGKALHVRHYQIKLKGPVIPENILVGSQLDLRNNRMHTIRSVLFWGQLCQGCFFQFTAWQSLESFPNICATTAIDGCCSRNNRNPCSGSLTVRFFFYRRSNVNGQLAQQWAQTVFLAL